jgi:hypothetical protein
MTRVTRAIGLDDLFFFALETAFFTDFFAPVTALVALFFALVTALVALFFAVATFFFAPATFFVPLRRVLDIVAGPRLFFTAGRRAPFFAVLLPDCPRDLLAFFIAIVLLLGVGDELSPRIARNGR